jgi:hypothetical protein
MGDRRGTSLEVGVRAEALAARLAAHGYQTWFPTGRDPATFKVTGLPDDPDVEVSAGDDGGTSCHYTGRSRAEAASVIARLPVPGRPRAQAADRDTLTATWDGIEIEWHCTPPGEECPAGPEQAAPAALLAHLAVLGGGFHDGEDELR